MVKTRAATTRCTHGVACVHAQSNVSPSNTVSYTSSSQITPRLYAEDCTRLRILGSLRVLKDRLLILAVSSCPIPALHDKFIFDFD